MVVVLTPDGQRLMQPVPRWVPDELTTRLRAFSPRSELGRLVKLCFSFLPPELAGELLDRISSTVILESSLALVAIRPRPAGWLPADVEDYGIVSRKVITTAGVNALVDAWETTFTLNNFKFHGIGTGTNSEANGDTALQTELTTEYNPNSTRATGTTVDGASANILQSVGTNTLDSGTPAITEHGILSQAATGGGTLWDRSVFSAINLVGANGDGLQSTYNMTASAGG